MRRRSIFELNIIQHEIKTIVMKKRESRIANNPVHTRPTGITVFVAILSIAVSLMLSCHPHKQKPTNHTFNIPVAEEVTPESNLEIPVLDKEESNLQLIEHYAFTVNYQKAWKIPRWVAYQLTADEVDGTAERKKHFIPDPELDIEVSAVNDDYRNNNRDLDRGHMAPAADMKWSERAMEESFFFSNVCPQNHNLNCGDWNDLEERVRGWAKYFGSAYIACGPIVSSKKPTTIGPAKVVVPDAFFKVILVENKDGWQAIGFIMKNEAGSRNLSQYAVSIDEVEKITGMDFFSGLDDSIEDQIEKSFNLSQWKLK